VLVLGDAVFVLTHEPPADWPYPDAPFTFVTDGLERAIAQAEVAAGGRDVSVSAGAIAGQAPAGGVGRRAAYRPGTGRVRHRRAFFGEFTGAHQLLEDPQIVQGDRVTHLHDRVPTRDVS